jgi:hypothetical protein
MTTGFISLPAGDMSWSWLLNENFILVEQFKPEERESERVLLTRSQLGVRCDFAGARTVRKDA